MILLLRVLLIWNLLGNRAIFANGAVEIPLYCDLGTAMAVGALSQNKIDIGYGSLGRASMDCGKTVFTNNVNILTY